MDIRESLGVSFEIRNPCRRLLHIPERDFSLSYYVAESLWYFLGNNETAWIANYSSFWKKISDDGETANSAYGARIFKRHALIGDSAVNQWQYIKEELERDPDSRRAVIHIRTPHDSIPELASKDVPCTLTLQFFIREGRLFMITNMRSSDLIFGISYDVPFFTLLQERLAHELGVGLGTYRHVSGSLHIYQRHFEMAEAMLKNRKLKGELRLLNDAPPSWPGPCPTEKLDRIQESARALNGREWMMKLIHDQVEPLDPYWRDWAKILVAHRCRKVGLDDVSHDLLRSLDFEGYREFDR
jgi:thymidylate synthase